MMMQEMMMQQQMQIMAPPPDQPREVGPAMDGGVVQQVRQPGMHQKIHEQATFQVHNPTTVQTHEVAPPQYSPGVATEQEMPPQYVNIDQEHAVMGPTEQQVHELHRVVHEPVEQVVEQVVHIPKVVQER